jgi:FAD-dependent urate hydroxylase
MTSGGTRDRHLRGLLSLGFGGASISGMKYSIPRLVGGITGSFFVEEL